MCVEAGLGVHITPPHRPGDRARPFFLSVCARCIMMADLYMHVTFMGLFRLFLTPNVQVLVGQVGSS